MTRKEGLKIAFLDSWFLEQSQGSGTTVAIRGLSEALISMGCIVDIISPTIKNRPTIMRRLLYNFLLPLKFDQDNYDVIVGFDIDGCFLKPKRHDNYHVFLHGIAGEEAKFESGFSRMFLLFLSLLERNNVSKAKKVFVSSSHSQKIASQFYQLPEDKISVVPNGIFLRFWEETFQRQLNKKEVVPHIISVARQYPRKNTSFLITAMKEVVFRIPEARLTVVGGGPMVDSLRSQVSELGLSENIEIVGEVPANKDVVNFYEQASLFCLPSLQEGFGIVFLEAMCSGLPIVAMNVSAVPEVLGDCALLVQENDLQGLSDSIIRILQDEELYKTLQSKGRKRVENFDWTVVAKCFLESLVI
tara:strand:- start:57 stop:1133 length:1077 start_codon:yes stop_codon:yes gene_type:complete